MKLNKRTQYRRIKLKKIQMIKKLKDWKKKKHVTR